MKVDAPSTLVPLLDEDRLPGAGAVAEPGHASSWSEVRDRADRVHAALSELEVRPGDRVGIHLESSVHTMVAVHGVLRAGGVVVPIDPRAPAIHVGGLLADCDVEVLITDAPARRVAAVAEAHALRAVVGPEEAPVGVESVSWDEVAARDAREPAGRAPGDLAYVIYTSGSTGAPKGIAHTHASAMAYARLAATIYALGPHDVVATLSPLHFDQSTFSLYAAPLAGASVLLVPDAVLRFPASLTQVVADHGVTVWYSVPTLLRQVLRRGVLGERDLSAVRWILYGGESFPPAELAALMRQLPGARVSNVYGPAEVNQCTFFHLDESPTGDDPVPIGRAWPETEIVVVDEQQRPVEPGAAGEILVRSVTAMQGYWNRPDLTASAFRTLDVDGAGPGDAGEGVGWYATGDLGTWRADGELVFLGRADNQVKVRGHRVELEAVDLALGSVAGVDLGVAVTRPGAEGTELVALVTPADPGAPPTPEGVRRAVSRLVPAYAVPAEVLVVAALPRTTTGKVDRRSASGLLGSPS